jgi:hypothetical protein
MNVSENFKLVHNSGMVILVVDDKEVRSYRYSSVEVRRKRMDEWTKTIQRLDVEVSAYIKVIPDWHLWNGRINGEQHKPIINGAIGVGGSNGRKISIPKGEYSPSGSTYINRK